MPERLTARPLAATVDPETVFRMVESEASDVFWLDAGADADDGWSFVGEGVRTTVPVDVRVDVERVDPSLPPFLGGRVGWLDYESGARAAGAPSSDPEPPGSAWLRVTRAVAFDHSTGRVWVLADDDETDEWAARVSATSVPADDDGPGVRDHGRTVAATGRHTPDEYAAQIGRAHV